MTVLYRWINGKRYSTDEPIPNGNVSRSDLPRPMISSDFKAYDCPITGKMIEGRAAHAENLKRNDCRILESGEKEHNTKTGREYAEKAMDTAIDNAVDEVARDLLV